MTLSNQDSFFTHCGTLLTQDHLKKHATHPFKEHPKLAVLTDVLSRMQMHHANLSADFPPQMNLSFLTALLHHLHDESMPSPLRHADLLYLDTHSLTLESKAIETELKSLESTLSTREHGLLIALSSDDPMLFSLLKPLLHHPKCRFLIFKHKMAKQAIALEQDFDHIYLEAPTQADIHLILKLKRAELENYHHIVIPEELLDYAYSLAERFLSTTNTLEKALLLLDSGAARATMIERIDSNNPMKPVMTLFNLTSVLSGWTQIPATHLQIHKFKYSEFIQNMQQRIFGQDAAIAVLAHELQQSQAHLQKQNGPFASLLFAGPHHCGKQTTALALTHQLFKQPNVLFCAQLTGQTTTSILDLRFQRVTDKKGFILKELIQSTPHAILMIEQIDRASEPVIESLIEILNTGIIQDQAGDPYHFHQAILILTTTISADLLNDIAKSFTPEPESQDMDLLQLVLSEQKTESHSAQHFTPQEIADAVREVASSSLPSALNQQLHVIPFLPLNPYAVEKIFRLKLKQLGKALEDRYGVELGYAPEVIRYLMNQLQLKSNGHHHSIDIDTVLKQLYFVVEQAVLNQAENKNRPHQLILQLNETGEILRCDWLTTVPRQHAT